MGAAEPDASPPVEVTIEGIDDDGLSPGETVMVEVPAGEAETLTAQELESGEGLSGGLGDGIRAARRLRGGGGNGVRVDFRNENPL